MKILIIAGILYLIIWLESYISYNLLKKRTLNRKKWGLNICCGKTDGGNINVDIVRHANLPNMVIVDVYCLPFKDDAFTDVLSSHTIEHLDHPDHFYKELKRVGKNITLIIPPLWDFSAVINILEHQWIFLSFRKVHHTLPRYVKLPLARTWQRLTKQKLRA